MTYVDRTLNCVDCGVEFIHSAADQEYYAQKGFVSDPKRCTSCRASRRASARRRLRRPRHRRPARLRARRRPPDPRVLRGHLLVVRQPGPGAVQAAHGPAGLLLRLLPDGQARLSRPRVACRVRRPQAASEPERVAGPIALAMAAAPDRDPRPRRGPATRRPGRRRAVSSSMPEDDRAARRLERDQRRQRLRPRVVVGHDRRARRRTRARAASAAATAATRNRKSNVWPARTIAPAEQPARTAPRSCAAASARPTALPSAPRAGSPGLPPDR